MSSNFIDSNRCSMPQYNFFEKLFFWWLKDVACQIKRHDVLTSNFHHTLPEYLSEILANHLERAWEEEKSEALSKERRASLWLAIAKAYCWDFMKFAILSACSCVILILQPQLLRLAMSYFEVESRMPSLHAYATAAIFVILMLLHAALDCHGEYQLTLVGTRAKIASSSLIYRKMLRLSSSASHRRADTLISADVAKFECLFYCIPYVVMLPLQVATTFCLVWQMLAFGPAAVGIALVIVQTLPIKALYHKISLGLRATQAAKTNERISLINEIVQGIRTVKLNLSETYFEKLVFRSRKSEIGDFINMSYLTAAMWVLATASHRLCSFVVATLYVSQRGLIKAVQILPVNLHFFNLRSNFVYFFFGVRTFVDMHASVKRIEEFLLLEEIETRTEYLANPNCNDLILLRNMTASWDGKSAEKTLENINVDFAAKKLYAIVGSPGSGKSSLLKAILGELPTTSGETIVRGKMSYASQEPWLLASSIRDNITLGEIYDEERYERVASVCQLLDDFEQLPNGDQTPVVDKRIKLSESQCAKINIARAVYREADVYLFDEALSTVDTRVAKAVIDNCINGLLKDKTRLLVTKHVERLNNADEIILLEHGKIQFKGKPTDFRKIDEYSGFSLDDSSAIPTNEPSANEIETAADDSEIDDEANIITNGESENNVIAEPRESDNFIAKRAKERSVYQRYIQAGSSFLLKVFIAFNVVFILSVSAFDFELASWGQYGSGLSTIVNQTRYPVEKSYSTYVHDRPWILGSLIVLIIVSAICKNVCLYKFSFNANETIHNRMFSRLIRAPLQLFELNPSERILNLFSKVTDNMDSTLSESLFESVQTSSHAIAILLPIYMVDWRIVFPTILALYFYSKIGRAYASSIKKLKKLVATARHPVLSCVVSSLEGLATIRAYTAEKRARSSFDALQDRHTAVHLLAVALVQAFSFWMQLITVGLFALVLFGSIALKTDHGYVGLALMQLLSLGFLVASLVGCVAETKSCATSVARMLQCADLETEALAGAEASCRATQRWPDRGEIEFRQLRPRHPGYDQQAPNDLNILIRSGAKVNLVGPTGLVVAALHRLAEFDGDALIDGVDVKQVSLAVLRSRISIITRDPIPFAATPRGNLDPRNEFDDLSLWSALDDVELKRTFHSLDCRIDPKANCLTKTQRYLLCLATAILKRNKILVLDQVVDNVDTSAKALIDNIIRTKFGDCTVLIVN